MKIDINNYFTLRNLKEWLETIPEYERETTPVLIAGDDQAFFFNFEKITVSEDEPIIIDSTGHLFLFDDHYNCHGITKIVPDIKEYIQLNNTHNKFTSVQDILNKINEEDLDLLVFNWQWGDLKHATDKGIGMWLKDSQDAIDTMDCGLSCGLDYDVNLDNIVQNYLKSWTQAFVIEECDGDSYQDYRFYMAC